MQRSRKTNKYLIFLLGYVLIWGGYFGTRSFRFMTMERADGVITRVLREQFVVSSRSGDYKSSYPCPEVRFRYHSPAADTGTWHTTKKQALSFSEYKSGDSATVIFPKGRPEMAGIYSWGEFWLPTPYLIILLVISLFSSIGVVVVVFKPWNRG